MLLDDMRYWIENRTYIPKEIAVRFHHRLVKIHLFPNGNGRHARILADAILTKIFGEEPIDWAKGNNPQSMKERRNAYIEALREADQDKYELLFRFVDL